MKIFCHQCKYFAIVAGLWTVTRNAVNKSVWRKKDCCWLPWNKYAMKIWLSSLRIRAHLSWRTGKHLHVLHVLRTYSTCSYPGYQDTTTYAVLGKYNTHTHTHTRTHEIQIQINCIYYILDLDKASMQSIIAKYQKYTKSNIYTSTLRSSLLSVLGLIFFKELITAKARECWAAAASL